MSNIKTDPELLRLLERSKEIVRNMTPEERVEMIEIQRQSWLRSCEPCEHGNDWEDCPDCWATLH